MLRGFGLWAVVRKPDGVFVGRVGLLYPEGWPGLEVGWTLAKPYWGLGYATEAAKASIRFGFRETSTPRLISLIHPENGPSQKVAARLGQIKSERTSITLFGKTHEADVWAIDRNRWTAN
jgi:RimJ/RimL family protein N-acetyltransferase